MGRVSQPLTVGAVYESDNSDMGVLPPFTEYLFLVLEAWFVREDVRYPTAKVLIIDGDHIFHSGTVYVINPACWLWTGAWRIA